MIGQFSMSALAKSSLFVQSCNFCVPVSANAVPSSSGQLIVVLLPTPAVAQPMRGEGGQWHRVYVCVRALKEKRLELSTPNFVHIYSKAGPRRGLTRRSKGQRSVSQGYEMCCRRARVCMSIWLFSFLV